MDINLRDSLQAIRKRIWVLLVMIFAVCGATSVVSFWVLDPVYQASARLIVNNANPAANQQLNINDINASIRLVETYKELVKSPYILDMVANEHPEFQLSPERLVDHVQVRSVRDTQLLEIVVQHGSYETAAQIANAVADVFKREVPNIMSVNNITIISKAKPELQAAPIKPKPLLNIAISFVVGLMGGIVVVLLLEYFDDTIKTEDDVRAVLDLPTIGTIEKFSKSNLQDAPRKIVAEQIGVPPMRHTVDKYPLIVARKPLSPISEAYRSIRTNIEFSSADKPIRTVMLTSSIPDEGKSITAANLAITFAQAEKKVLLIDCDMRKPTQHYIFQCSNRTGLSHVLVKQAESSGEVVVSTEIEGLDVMPSGTIPPNPAELLSSKRMEGLLEEVRERYDVVILDTPPVLAVADAQILARKCDGVVLVLHAGRVKRDAARKAKAALEIADARTLGVVLNGVSRGGAMHYYYGR